MPTSNLIIKMEIFRFYHHLKGFGVIFPILHTPFSIPLLHFLQLLRPVVAYSTQYLASDAILSHTFAWDKRSRGPGSRDVTRTPF